MYRLTSSDDWHSATLTAVANLTYAEGTTVTPRWEYIQTIDLINRHNRNYVVHAHFAGGSQYEIERVDLPTPDLIEFNNSGIFPGNHNLSQILLRSLEGIEYHPQYNFLIGSFFGTIFSVNDLGYLTPVIQDPRLQVIVGLHVDKFRNKLYFLNVNASVFAGATSGFMSR